MRCKDDGRKIRKRSCRRDFVVRLSRGSIYNAGCIKFGVQKWIPWRA